MKYGPLYPVLLGVSALATLGAILTLLPVPTASWPCILGYKALCTFTPASTFACALLAALSCTIRARLVRRWTFPAFVPVAVFVILIVGFTVSTSVWAAAKATYASPASTDAASGASPAAQQ